MIRMARRRKVEEETVEEAREEVPAAEESLDTELAGFLEPLADVFPGRLERRRMSAVARASLDGELDVAYTTMDSPFGRLLVAETPKGIVRIAFESEDFDAVVEELAREVSPRIVHAEQHLQLVVNHFDAYFHGYVHEFFVDADLSMSKGFRRQVLEELQRIPYGETRSYRDIAVAVGNPKAVRAVGSACATNPVPFIVPCHRVLRSDGGIGNYLGGTESKRKILEVEGALGEQPYQARPEARS